MSKKHPPHGEGPSRYNGPDQHGWSEDLDDANQDNPSGHRSFHPDDHAPGPKRSGRPSERDKEASLSGTPVESETRSGEDHAGKSQEKGREGKGRRGRSQRPSGSKGSSAFTGVDPQDPPTNHSGR
ncbi:hypothetical protein FBY35_3776 [Streptomyces sp. SLBN-118]|uniref:hypothetical protein n=1 Tax=Streptomyces sp. SLBN-118 TaxID=2768454 RepID=UPI001152596F|nr:hypothetical protein [Streptomyces sp. SLBN-118]TQK42378.1 hypothetical protein FBY35_3776 [Streptomyces sp. SLBN-118]